MARSGKVHFVRSTQVHAADLLRVGGQPVWNDTFSLFARIDELCGDGASDLFAEPNAKDQGGDRLAVAWFGAAEGEPRRLDALDRGMRARVEADLVRKLEAIQPAVSDASIGEAVSAMLNVADPESLVAVGDEAVIIDWGLLPAAARGTQGAFIAHTARTIGPYLPAGLSPLVPGLAWTAAAGSGTAGMSPPRRASAAGSDGVAVSAMHSVPVSRRRAWIWPLAVLSLLFAAALAYAAWPGHLIYPEVIAPTPPPPLVDNGELNRSLEQRITLLQQELVEGCAADPSVLGALEQSVPPPASGPGTGAGTGETPPPNGPGSGPPASAASQLREELGAATVLILTPIPGGMATGSGFFVGPRDILTNRHVIEDATGSVHVASKALGRVLPVQIVARSGDTGSGGADFALLRVAATPANVAILPLATHIEQMENVIAGGFPGSIMAMDDTYQAILAGDLSQVGKLSMVYTTGSVMLFPTMGGTKVIAHSASISPGNSGGPLTDACGRAVGVNTFIRKSSGEVDKLNFSLAASDAVRFLAANGVTITPADNACSPAPATAEAAPPPAAGAAQ